MSKIGFASKKFTIYTIEIIYMIGSLAITFGPWVFFIYSLGFRVEGIEFELRSLIKLFALWTTLPLVVFAWLLDLYAKKIKRGSVRLQKYGFLGKGIYSSKASKKSG